MPSHYFKGDPALEEAAFRSDPVIEEAAEGLRYFSSPDYMPEVTRRTQEVEREAQSSFERWCRGVWWHGRGR